MRFTGKSWQLGLQRVTCREPTVQPVTALDPCPGFWDVLRLSGGALGGPFSHRLFLCTRTLPVGVRDPTTFGLQQFEILMKSASAGWVSQESPAFCFEVIAGWGAASMGLFFLVQPDCCKGMALRVRNWGCSGVRSRAGSGPRGGCYRDGDQS